MNNKIHKILLVCAAAAVLVSSVAVGRVTGARDTAIAEEIYKVNERSKKYSETNSEIKREALAKSDALKAQLGGVVCWGDYNTVGVEGYAFSNKISEYFAANNLELPVENNGVAGEDSLSVLGRQGGIPLVVEQFQLLKSPELQVIKITSEGGEEVNVLCKPENPGLNPVSIGGVEGLVGGSADDEDKNKTASFYFRRDKGGSAFEIASGTTVVTHTDKEYNKYINVFWIGDNGGWNNDPQTLLNQLTRATDIVQGGRYIVIGLSEGDASSNAEVDSLLSAKFGDKYINPRTVVIDSVRANGTDNLTDSELVDMQNGKIPKSALNINARIGREGLEAIGERVCEIIESSNYLAVQNG